MPNKLRISLYEQGAEIKGDILLPADGTFTFECLKMALEQMSEGNNLDFKEVVADFYRFCVRQTQD
jgi:hypothetical protein